MQFARIAALLAMFFALPGAAFAAYALLPYQTFTMGSRPGAVAIGDVDGDGRADVVLTTDRWFDDPDNNKLLIYFQKDDGALDTPRRFDYAPFSEHSGITLADLDGDDAMEIIVGHLGGITIMDWAPVHGRMTLRSQIHTVGQWDPLLPKAAYQVVAVDIDRDGALDIFGLSWSNGARIYFGDGRGGITRRVDVPTPASGYNSLASGDLNGDGHDDVVVTSGQGVTRASVYYNDGTDDLAPLVAMDPNPGHLDYEGTVAISDLNADGREDLVLLRDRDNLVLYHQSPSGLLQPPIVLPTDASPDVAVGHDMDLDGREDLVVQHKNGRPGIYLQGDSGLLPEVTADGPMGNHHNTQGLAVGDINGDHCPDVAVAEYASGLVVHLGTGCNAIADLAPSLGLTSSVAALRLDNFGTGAAVGLDATVELVVNSGTLAIGTLPGECIVDAQTDRSAKITCIDAQLAAHGSRTHLLPITISGGHDLRNVLTATASVHTTSAEARYDNNVARRQMRLAGAPAPSKALSPKQPARK